MNKAFTLLETIAGPVQREIGELEFPSRKCPHVRPSICADGMMLQDRSRSNFRAKEGVFPGLQLIRRPIEAARGGPFVDDKSPCHASRYMSWRFGAQNTTSRRQSDLVGAGPLFLNLFPTTKPWVPRPCVSCKGGNRHCRQNFLLVPLC